MYNIFEKLFSFDIADHFGYTVRQASGDRFAKNKKRNSFEPRRGQKAYKKKLVYIRTEGQ